MSFETPADVWRNAKHNGVSFRVDAEAGKLIASPRSQVTKELSEGIKVHREALMKRAYILLVLDWLDEHYVEGSDMEFIANEIDAIKHAATLPLDFKAMYLMVRERANAVRKEYMRADKEGKGA